MIEDIDRKYTMNVAKVNFTLLAEFPIFGN